MSVSVVMPTYNEQKVIEKVVRDYYAEVISKIEGSEFIIVNDCSTDSTPEILKRLARELPQLKIINLEQNTGHGQALRTGFNRVRNPLIFHVDSDNQFRAEDFWKLYPAAEKNDIVLGQRISRRDSMHRKIISLIVKLINIVVFGIWINDINSPFKLLKTEVLKNIIRDISPDSFPLSILLLIIAKYKGYRIAEIPVTHYARKTGKGALTGMYLFKRCLFCLVDIFRLKKYLLFKKLLKRKT